jgi:hypothetical protein
VYSCRAVEGRLRRGSQPVTASRRDPNRCPSLGCSWAEAAAAAAAAAPAAATAAAMTAGRNVVVPVATPEAAPPPLLETRTDGSAVPSPISGDGAPDGSKPRHHARRSSVQLFKGALHTHGVMEEVKSLQDNVVATVGRSYQDVVAEEEHHRNMRSQHGWVILPESTYRLVWDVLLVVFLLYVAVMVPLRLAFDTEDMPTSVEAYSNVFWVEVIIDVAFVMDIFFNFR